MARSTDEAHRDIRNPLSCDVRVWPMEPYLISQTGDRSTRPPCLPVWAGAFVALVCVAMLALGAWHELDARSSTLHRSEIEMANIARSLTQHAEDSIPCARPRDPSAGRRSRTLGSRERSPGWALSWA